MRSYLPSIARYLLGAIFTLAGVTWFFMAPPPPPERLLAFMTGVASTGYFLPLLKTTETVCGLMLLTNRFVPLALVILSPIVVQITALHLVLERSGLGIALLLVLLLSYLGWAYRRYFQGLLTAKTQPAKGSLVASSNRATATAE